MYDAMMKPEMLAHKKISPLLKWPGGKSAELPVIIANMPEQFDRFYEPFLGGGAVFWSISPDVPAFVNDISRDLMDFYKSIADQDADFFGTLKKFEEGWESIQGLVLEEKKTLLAIYSRGKTNPALVDKEVESFVTKKKAEVKKILGRKLNYDESFFEHELLLNLKRKIKRTSDVEGERGLASQDDILNNIECAVKSSFYMYIRRLYNQSTKYGVSTGVKSALFFLLREYAYASMFRFNSKGEFNVPYGGISYNRKDIASKISVMKSKAVFCRLTHANLGNCDFYEYMRTHPPSSNDFVFIDPPYDTDFSDYDQNSFCKKDQKRLAEYLTDECRGKFMVVIKNTDYIHKLYDKPGINISKFDKKYMWTIKERNNRDTVHLLIKNY